MRRGICVASRSRCLFSRFSVSYQSRVSSLISMNSSRYLSAVVHPIPAPVSNNNSVTNDSPLNVAGHNPHLEPANNHNNHIEVIPVDVMLERLEMTKNGVNGDDLEKQPFSPSSSNDRLVTAVVVGAGNRGSSYCNFALDQPHRLKIVGVVDPIPERRALIAEKHSIPESHQFSDWSHMLSLPKMADIAIIATPDRAHHEPCTQFAKHGYHILLEKPMAVTESECMDIVSSASHHNILFAVCHVLRYTPVNRLLSSLISSGLIGELINIQHTEPVGYYHFAHSYVRGQWQNSNTSTFSLMAKSCHDVDLIRYWMGGHSNPPVRVSSFGSLTHFTSKNKPKNASKTCLTCAHEPMCAYSAKKIYLDPLVKSNFKGWPTSALTPGVPDIESVIDALQQGPFGRCVYDSNNNVCDHQVVNFEFEKGQTASFTMIAFSEKLCKRQTKIYGSKGELTCIDGTEIRHFDFNTNTTKIYKGCDLSKVGRLIGHDGADFYLMDSFVRAVANKDKSMIATGPMDALASHLLVFAAEKSRLERRVIELDNMKMEGLMAAKNPLVNQASVAISEKRKHRQVELDEEKPATEEKEMLSQEI